MKVNVPVSLPKMGTVESVELHLDLSEIIREAKAEAWDEGHRAGWRNATSGPVRTNPYSADAEEF